MRIGILGSGLMGGKLGMIFATAGQYRGAAASLRRRLASSIPQVAP
jgi:prephenate dehydrogenase